MSKRVMAQIRSAARWRLIGSAILAVALIAPIYFRGGGAASGERSAYSLANSRRTADAPDHHIADPSLANAKKITTDNPQQKVSSVVRLGAARLRENDSANC